MTVPHSIGGNTASYPRTSLIYASTLITLGLPLILRSRYDLLLPTELLSYCPVDIYKVLCLHHNERSIFCVFSSTEKSYTDIYAFYIFFSRVYALILDYFRDLFL